MPPSKQTIFFSHSSQDAVLLGRLRELFLKKTGGTIEVFLSSDGQSIPFGRNWVHRLEEALRSSALMFVFVSPHSLRSQWVLFEAGFAYGNRVEVVPVGIEGVDVGAIGPPLSLLQGFNITSADSLSNLTATTNRLFQYSHERFAQQEYDGLFSGTSPAPSLGSYAAALDDVHVGISETILERSAAETLALVPSVARRLGVPCTERNESRLLPGLTFHLPSGTRPPYIQVSIDPGAFAVACAVVDSLLSEVRTEGCSGVEFRFVMGPQVGAVLDEHKISGRLAGDGVTIGSSRHEYHWEDVEFGLDYQTRFVNSGFQAGAAELMIRSRVKAFPVQRASSLLSLLFERGLLFVGE